MQASTWRDVVQVEHCCHILPCASMESLVTKLDALLMTLLLMTLQQHSCLDFTAQSLKNPLHKIWAIQPSYNQN
jgi:hypothetical protein